MDGVVYTKTNDPMRATLCGYHRKPDALMLNKTNFLVDLTGIKPSQRYNLVSFEDREITSKFTIGFEIEKTNISRNAIIEHELIAGYERDASCGYEAVTHVLPLLPRGLWRTKVFDMMHKAERIIDDRYSRSNQRCGGHITVSYDGMDAAELNAYVRRFSGILFAMFRYRLKNGYCGANRRMQERGLDNYDGIDHMWYWSNGWHHKYQPALVKGSLLEFRIPSRVESVKQMMRRYELMYEICTQAVLNPRGKQAPFFKKIRPIIKSMYNGDDAKTDGIIALAKHFQKFINDGIIDESIRKYI